MATRATGDLSDNLSRAVLEQNDPETVRQGAPAFLLMLDGFIGGDPDNLFIFGFSRGAIACTRTVCGAAADRSWR